jgi:hypothetical protein
MITADGSGKTKNVKSILWGNTATTLWPNIPSIGSLEKRIEYYLPASQWTNVPDVILLQGILNGVEGMVIIAETLAQDGRPKWNLVPGVILLQGIVNGVERMAMVAEPSAQV